MPEVEGVELQEGPEAEGRQEVEAEEKAKVKRSPQNYPTSRLRGSRTTGEDVSLPRWTRANVCRGDADSQNASSRNDGGTSLDEDAEISDESSSEDVATNRTTNSYASLLQALEAQEPCGPPARKRRKLSDDDTNGHEVARNRGRHASKTSEDGNDGPDGPLPRQHAEDVEDDTGMESNSEGSAKDSLSGDKDQEEYDVGTFDPFEKHFAYAEPDVLEAYLKTPPEQRWITKPARLSASVRITAMPPVAVKVHAVRSPLQMTFKSRLRGRADRLWGELDATQRDLAAPILQYMDIISGARVFQDPAKLRDAIALHALDHIFKTRDQVIKNNAKLSQQNGSETLDLRDQGFTRPKVLFLLPTRQSCVKLVDSIVSMSEPEQQEYKARFQESFGGQDDKTWDDKPEDFRDLFSGNDDDMFRIGLKFTRKTVKYFSAFYSSDVIIASPLGLRKAIENSGDGKDKKKSHDADFLSSIEIVVVDHANALQMQNWQHVEYIFSQLNLLPREAHGCDFSRVRTWYLDKHARYLRQTIVLSDFVTPEINALSSAHMHNIAGKVKYVPLYKGAMLDLPQTVPPNTIQTFLRFDSPTPAQDPNARFQYFSSTILAQLLRDRNAKRTLIFVPSSFDFIRLRNHLATANETAPLSFGAISEYTSVRDVMRARSHFLSGRHSVVLYSERAHHFRRYQLKGVRRIVFYGVPENPTFWAEIVGFLGLNGPESDGGGGKGAVKAMFSKWDVLRMERIVGTERVRKLVADRGGDTFDFV